MKELKRIIEAKLLQHLKPNKVIVLEGPRRVGKTVLLKHILSQVSKKYLLLHGEDNDTIAILENRSIQNYKNLLGENELLVIDEAQKIPDIGTKLKLMVDNIKNLKIIITGSSAFDIQNQTGEPLTGRKHTFKLFAFSEMEFNQVENIIEKKSNVNQRLVFGNYPELLQIKNKESKIEYLKEILNSYLLKDILAFQNIKNSHKIFDLLRLISLQIGGEVSLQELASQLSMSKNTVEKYLDILSKVYILYNVRGFSKNLRKEITKTSRWYFLDNGLRNAVIANLNPIELRSDIGALWENYIISERLKYQNYSGMMVNNFFWRTYDQQEIDWVEERQGKIFAYEFKWNPKKKVKVPVAWENAYPDSEFQVIHRDNYMEWISS